MDWCCRRMRSRDYGLNRVEGGYPQSWLMQSLMSCIGKWCESCDHELTGAVFADVATTIWRTN